MWQVRFCPPALLALFCDLVFYTDVWVRDITCPCWAARRCSRHWPSLSAKPFRCPAYSDAEVCQGRKRWGLNKTFGQNIEQKQSQTFEQNQTIFFKSHWHAVDFKMANIFVFPTQNHWGFASKACQASALVGLALFQYKFSIKSRLFTHRVWFPEWRKKLWKMHKLSNNWVHWFTTFACIISDILLKSSISWPWGCATYKWWLVQSTKWNLPGLVARAYSNEALPFCPSPPLGGEGQNVRAS